MNLEKVILILKHSTNYTQKRYNQLHNIDKGKEISDKIKNQPSKKKLELTTTSGIIFNSLSKHEILTKEVNKNTVNRLTNILDKINTKENLELNSFIYKSIADYYSLIGNSKKAMLNFNIYDKLRDSIAMDRVSAINRSLKRKFNEDIKEKENLQLKADNATQELLTQKANTRNWLLAFGLLAFGISAFFI